MRVLRERKGCRALSWIISIAMIVTMLTAGMMIQTSEASAASADSIPAPRVTTDKSTWDCVYFGSYPQTEIVDKASRSGCYGKDWAENGDHEVNSSLYSQLKSASYNSNGDTTISGVKYRRIKESDVTYSYSGDSPNMMEDYYNWSDSTTYHYFRYDKIKWRVIEKNGNEAMLLADKVLDDQRYNTALASITWAGSTIRSWLNGYGSSYNDYGTDYSSKSFIDSAFTSSEQSAIKTATLANDKNIEYGTAGGAGTNDKVFLLSEKDVWYTDKAVSHGFAKADPYPYPKQRIAKSSTYAKAMGMCSDTASDNLGSCEWWLRSPGYYRDYAAVVDWHGFVDNFGGAVSYSDDFVLDFGGIRPALYLNLASDVWSYAGTVTVACPTATKIISVKGARKAFTAKWKKKSCTGYQLRYSLKPGMGSSKTVTIKKASATTKKITGLKAKKKYYVQVRTYMTVEGRNYYSSWSAKKSVKTK